MSIHIHVGARKRLKAVDALKLIGSVDREGVVAKIYRNPEVDEYQVKLFIDGVYQSGADYFTDDKADAFDTASAMLSRAVRAKLNEKIWS